jgi:MFS superfamily sulfate permease-like transporter
MRLRTLQMSVLPQPTPSELIHNVALCWLGFLQVLLGFAACCVRAPMYLANVQYIQKHAADVGTEYLPSFAEIYPLQVLPGIVACRVDAPMYFANVQYIHDRLRKYVARAGQYSEAAGMPLQYLLLDMSPVTHIDSTGGRPAAQYGGSQQHCMDPRPCIQGPGVSCCCFCSTGGGPEIFNEMAEAGLQIMCNRCSICC